MQCFWALVLTVLVVKTYFLPRSETMRWGVTAVTADTWSIRTFLQAWRTEEDGGKTSGKPADKIHK